MNFDLHSWLENFTNEILKHFNKRVLFIGYQGSYKRGEAAPNSDVDMVVILDKADIEDLKIYRQIVQNLPHSEKACGFFGGSQEVINWPKSDIFQLIYDTAPLYGNLDNIAPKITKEDVKTAVKNGAANLYHAAVHSFLYDKDKKSSLTELFKGTFFVLQALYFYKTKNYICTKKELLPLLQNQDKEILQLCIDRKNFAQHNDEEIEAAYNKLILWASELITEKGENNK